jgi:hypothetical protein
MTPWAISITNVQTASFAHVPKGPTPIRDDGTGERKWCKTCQVEHPVYVFRSYYNAAGQKSYNPSCRSKYRSPK